MFAYGLWAGADGLAETCTTRLNYFLIQRFAGLGSVGLLDAGTKISESVWNISRSVSFIEYSSVAKTSEATEQKRITLQIELLRFSTRYGMYLIGTGMDIYGLSFQRRVQRHT